MSDGDVNAVNVNVDEDFWGSFVDLCWFSGPTKRAGNVVMSEPGFDVAGGRWLSLCEGVRKGRMGGESCCD